MAQAIRDRGRLQERLCRDTAPDHARPAESFSLDDCRRQPELGATDGADVPGRATTHEDHVKGSHIFLLDKNGKGASNSLDAPKIPAPGTTTLPHGRSNL